eukprot:3787974-Amphidinium_carterae.1
MGARVELSANFEIRMNQTGNDCMLELTFVRVLSRNNSCCSLPQPSLASACVKKPKRSSD